MNSNIVNSIHILEQEDIWLQFLRKDSFRGNSFKVKLFNYFKDPFLNFRFQRKYSPSFVFDNVVYGSNPIITILIINKILDSKNNKNKENIGIYFPTEIDYWGYEIILDEKINEIFSDIFGREIKKIEDVLDCVKNKLQEKNVDLILLDKRYRVDYSEYDRYTKSTFLYFSSEKNNLPEVNDYIARQNDIKKVVKFRFLKYMMENKILKKLFWNRVAPNKKKNFYVPIAIAKNIYFSSLPQGWMSLEHEVKNSTVIYSCKYEKYMFGSANSICSKISEYKNQAIKDISSVNIV